MKTVFLGERNMATSGSSLTGVHGGVPYGDATDYDYDDDGTPPAEDQPNHNHFARRRTSSVSVSDGGRSSYGSSLGASSFTTASSVMSASADAPFAAPSAWLELWDFVGCGSFRGFLAEDPTGETSLFAFFDASVLSRDLKRALMALIELADTALNCAHLVICVDRGGAEALPDEAATLLKGLQWAGFSLTTLDTWTGGACVDVTSSRWIFMGMEL